jgi:hypothetical protein
MRGIHQRGMQSPEGSDVANPIGNHPHAERGVPVWIVGDDPDVVRHTRDRRDLAIDDAAAAHHERRFVGTSEATRAAARENGCGDSKHNRRYHTVLIAIERAARANGKDV